MTTKFIEDIRKIAKTEDILKRLPNGKPDVDKASIGMRRGVGLADANVFNPCQLLYSSTDGSFTFAGLVAGTEGPRIQDGDYNHCTQVNTITGMRETGSSPTLEMVLKPDGIFFPINTGYMYTSAQTILNWIASPESFDSTTKWAFSTAQEVQDYLCSTAGLSAPEESTSISLEQTSITEDDIAGFNFSVDTPIYFSVIQLESEQYYCDYIFGVPSNYDGTLDPTNTEGTPLIIACPAGARTSAEIDESFVIMSYVDDVGSMFGSNSFQLAIDIGNTNLWKPNPDEHTAPVKYSQGVSIVTFEFGAGYTRTGMVRPAKDGGFALFETSEGDPTGNAYIYRRDRTLTTVIPVSQMAAWLA